MRELLEASFRAAVAAADPLQIVATHLPSRPKGRIFVAGAGKAAASMALATEKSYGSAVDGIVITRYGQSRPTDAAHPRSRGRPSGAG
jgi:glycerate 2-kinase